MRARSVVVGVAMVIGTLVMFGHARAQDEPYPISLTLGEIFDVCASGLIVCPAKRPICDDLKVAIPVDTNEGGLGFQGLAPGSTLCSAGTAAGPRRIFRVTVR